MKKWLIIGIIALIAVVGVAYYFGISGSDGNQQGNGGGTGGGTGGNGGNGSSGDVDYSMPDVTETLPSPHAYSFGDQVKVNGVKYVLSGSPNGKTWRRV